MRYVRVGEPQIEFCAEPVSTTTTPSEMSLSPAGGVPDGLKPTIRELCAVGEHGDLVLVELEEPAMDTSGRHLAIMMDRHRSG